MGFVGATSTTAIILFLSSVGNFQQSSQQHDFAQYNGRPRTNVTSKRMNEKAMNLDTSAHKHEPAINDDRMCPSIVYDKKRGLWHQVNDELDSSQSSFKLKGNIDVGYQETQESGEWSTKLLHCGKDCDICCLGFWCPCILYGQNVEATTGGDGFAHCCIAFWFVSHMPALQSFLSPLLTYDKRTMLRKAYDLPEEPCGDYCTHLCCYTCALCQEGRELKKRGHSAAHPVFDLFKRPTPVTMEAPPVLAGPCETTKTQNSVEMNRSVSIGLPLLENTESMEEGQVHEDVSFGFLTMKK